MADIVISGDSSGSITLRAPAVSGTTILTMPTTSGTLVTTAGGSTVPFALGSAAAPSITFTGDTNTGMFSPGADTIAFSEGGVESMRINSAGNLLLGSATEPFGRGYANYLSVSSAAATAIEINAGTGNLAYLDLGVNGTRSLSITTDNSICYVGAVTSIPLGFATAGTEKMRISSSGDVGIGTASPARLLHISGGAGLTYFQMSNNASGNTNADGFQIAQDGVNVDLINREAGYLGFNTSNTERMRITSAGNVGIGTSGPVNKLGLSPTANNTNERVINLYSLSTTAQSYVSIGSQFATNNSFVNSEIRFGNEATAGAASFLAFATSTDATPTERMRIDSAGVSHFGGISTLTDSAIIAYANGRGWAGKFQRPNNGNVVEFLNNASTSGAITISGTTTAYVTSSDYRLKENVTPMTGALDKVAQLKPVTYTWKAEQTYGEGFIAHELAEVCPLAVVNEKDEIDAEGKPIYQGIDTSFLVATLTAAIQELNAKVTALEAQLGAK